MRRAIVHILQCPQCRSGTLRPEADIAELVFGPLRCSECQAGYPVAEGVADLLGDGPARHPLQRTFDRPLVARSYERYVRPALQLALSRKRLDRDSEFLLYRSLLGAPQGPILDLGCGTGAFSRRLAREPGAPPVVGLDLSRAMVEEGSAQAREAGVVVDFVRAEALRLPFADGSFGAVLHAGSLHWMDELGPLWAEVQRVLKPHGRYVASTYLPPAARGLHRRAGLRPRTDDELRAAAEEAGFVKYERVVFAPFLVLKAEKA